jgi:hypothetical protein
MGQMSDTPETDKQWADWLNKLRMPIESFVDVARKLERERNHWKSESLEQAKLLAMGADREARLRAALQRITECDMRWSKKVAREALL